MEYNNRSIVIKELIGLRAKVILSSDAFQKGISGVVIDETKNVIVIGDGKFSRRVIKKNATFRFYSGKRSFVVDGKEINFRPAERTEKAMRFYRLRHP